MSNSWIREKGKIDKQGPNVFDIPITKGSLFLLKHVDPSKLNQCYW